jgi:hypothetical protein
MRLDSTALGPNSRPAKKINPGTEADSGRALHSERRGLDSGGLINPGTEADSGRALHSKRRGLDFGGNHEQQGKSCLLAKLNRAKRTASEQEIGAVVELQSRDRDPAQRHEINCRRKETADRAQICRRTRKNQQETRNRSVKARKAETDKQEPRNMLRSVDREYQAHS